MQAIKVDETTNVMYRQWRATLPKAVLLLVHGLGGHSSRWEFLSEFFLKNNISSYAIELKGFGETKDLKGHIDTFRIYFQDICTLHNIIKKENPGKKVFLLGESLGALISFSMAILNPDLFDALICISPVFKSKLKFSLFGYIKIFFSLLFNPKKQFNIPFDSQAITQDIGYQKVMDLDPREHRLASSKLLFEIVFTQIRAKILKNKIKIPVLFLLAGKDGLVDSNVSRKIFQDLKLEDKSIVEYPDMFHALSIEVGRERVFEDIFKWVQERL